MMYTVVRHFTDLLDNNYKYTEGDVYPREGYTPSEARIYELSTAANKQRTILIKPIPEAETAAKVAAEDTAENVSDTNVGETEEESDAENESEPVAEAEIENEEAEDKPRRRRKRDE